MNKKRQFFIAWLTVIVGLFAVQTTILETKAVRGKKDSKKGKRSERSEQDIIRWSSTYAEVLSLVEKRAFRTVDFPQFIQDSLKSAVSHVDAHSSFFTPKSYKAARESTSGRFSGIGVAIMPKGPEDDALVVVDVVPNGPAFKAGIQAGDKIVEITGKKLRGLSSDEVVTLLKGKVGTKLTLKVLRKKKLMSFTVVRDIIKDQTALSYRFKNQNVYYLSLKIFNEVAAQQMAKLLRKANAGRCKGIVLDLRRNPGGTLDSAIEMAGLFLKKGSLVVSTKDRDRKLVRAYRTTRDPILKSNTPIFILIDNFSASAAEILVGSLKHHSEHKKKHKNLMVFLVGTPTFGKGSVQELIPIKNGCALKITTMLYYLPNDISIQARGIKPDFTINKKYSPTAEMKLVNEFYGKETALKNHITVDEVKGKKPGDWKKGKKGFWSNLFGGKSDKQKQKSSGKNKRDKKKKEEKKKSWNERQKERLALDVQVQASVNMINLLEIAKKADAKALRTRNDALRFLKKNYLTDDVVPLEKIQ